MVDVSSWVHDEVDGVAESFPGGLVQAQVRLADVAGDYFKVIGTQPAESLDQLSVGVKGFFDALSGRDCVASRAMQINVLPDSDSR